MIEIPEAITISRQICDTLAGQSPHGFAFFGGGPITKKAYMDGSVYYFAACPPIVK